MSTPMPDDTHIRWAKISTEQQQIWDKYNKEIVPQIIKAALAKEPLSFKDLYQVLSIARLRCELEKLNTGPGYKENAYDVLRAVTHPFGLFQCGGTSENGIRSGWGEQVKQLVEERYKTDKYMRIALSLCMGSANGTVEHLAAPILERVDKIFQQLIHCDDFFEFLQLAARINYDLGNFPPIARGSAALSGWLFDSIMQVKFGIDTSCRPLLYDWTAFFESAEYYSNFYVLSTLSIYLKTIPGLYNKHQQFFDSIPAIMRKNPNVLENLQTREKVWLQMRSYIETELQTNALSSKHRKQLQNILKGKLVFRKPSNAFNNFFQLLKKYQPNKLNMTILNELITKSGYMKKNLLRLLVMHKHTEKIYLSTEYGDSLHADWVDLEQLRNLDSNQYIKKLGEILVTPNSMFTIPTFGLTEFYYELSPTELQRNLKKEPPTFIKSTREKIYFIDKQWNPIKMPPNLNLFRKMSLATWEELTPINPEILSLFKEPCKIEDPQTKALAKNLQDAVWHGGIKLQDLAGLNIDQVKLITSPTALAAYKENKFNRCTEILHTFRTEALSSQLDTILDAFETNIKNIGSHHPDARNRANTLLELLRNQKTTAFVNPTPQQLLAFKDEAAAAIQQAIPKLQKDLGWEVYLSNLAKQIANAVTTTLAKLATFGQLEHQGFFNIQKSDSAKMAENLAKNIDTQMKKP